MTDHDPLKNAFGERRDAAETVDIDAGLAGVHRRNSLAHRAARAGGVLAVVAVAVVGIAWFVQDDDGEPVFSTPGTTTEAPPVTTTPPDTTPPGSSTPVPSPTGFPSIIITDGSERILVDGVAFNPGVGGPITDAVDDLGGGLIFETADGIWRWAAATAEPVKIVEQLDRGNLNLIDVEVDGEDADTKIIFTDWFDPDGPGMQVLYRQDFEAAVTPDAVAQIASGESAVTNGGAGGANEAGKTLVALVISDGLCSQVHFVALGGGTDEIEADRCVPEGGGDAGVEELVRAVDLSHDGQLFVLDGTSLTHPDGRIVDLADGLDLPAVDGTATLDIWEPWLVVLTTAEGDGQVAIVELIEGTIEPVPDVPPGVTSARLARSIIELPSEFTEPAGQPFTVAAGDYRVVGVAGDDQLNVRSGPGPGYSIEGGVPNGGIVTVTGNALRLPDGAEWYELAWPEGQIVWANRAFLELADGVSEGDSFEELPCLAVGDPSLATSTTGDPGPPDTDHVSGLSYRVDGDCFRTVVHFGTAFDFEATGGPATHLPAGVTVQPSRDELSLEVLLPDEIDDVALGSAVDAGPALVVRDQNFHPYVEILSGRTQTWAATFLSNPARAVIDYVPVEPSEDEPFFPPFEEAGFIIRDIDGYDPATEQFSPPFTVTGFARPFEANVGLTMLDNQGRIFEEVVWSSAAGGERTGSQSFTMTTDWTTAWGRFSFTVESIPAGSYRLVLSDGGSDEPPTLTIPVTIEP